MRGSRIESIGRYDDVEPEVLTHHVGLQGRSEAAARFLIGQMIVEHKPAKVINARGQERSVSSLSLPKQVFENLGLLREDGWYYESSDIYKHFKSMMSLVREMDTIEARGEPVTWTRVHDKTRRNSKRRSPKRHGRTRSNAYGPSSHTITYEGDIQGWILDNFDEFAATCGAQDLTLISKEYPVSPTANVDILAVASDGTPFIIELKHTVKAKLAKIECRRALIGQVIEYMNALNFAHGLTSERDKLSSYLREMGVEEAIQHKFWTCVNANPPKVRTVIVTESYVGPLGEIVSFMRDRLGIDIDYAFLQETVCDGARYLGIELS